MNAKEALESARKRYVMRRDGDVALISIVDEEAVLALMAVASKSLAAEERKRPGLGEQERQLRSCHNFGEVHEAAAETLRVVREKVVPWLQAREQSGNTACNHAGLTGADLLHHLGESLR